MKQNKFYRLKYNSRFLPLPKASILQEFEYYLYEDKQFKKHVCIKQGHEWKPTKYNTIDEAIKDLGNTISIIGLYEVISSPLGNSRYKRIKARQDDDV